MTSVAVVGEPPGRTLAVPQDTSSGYLRAMGLRLAEGRWLTEQDQALRAPVAVINQVFARRFISGSQPLGRRVEAGDISLEIVGVIEDVRLLGLDSEPKPEIFVAYHLEEAMSGAVLDDGSGAAAVLLGLEEGHLDPPANDGVYLRTLRE